MVVQGRRPARRRNATRIGCAACTPTTASGPSAASSPPSPTTPPDTDYEQEYRIVTPAGEVRWIYARAEIERDAEGHALRMVGAHVDVTALKVAEAALRDSEERLRLALDAAQLGAWEVDLVTGTAQRTQRALEIFGYGAEEEVAIYPSWRDRVHPEDRPCAGGEVEAVRSGREDAATAWNTASCAATAAGSGSRATPAAPATTPRPACRRG